MSSRNRGQKTLSAEDTIDADVVNTIVLEADGQAGNANQYLKKDASNNLVYSDLVIPDNSIDGTKLTGNINISSTGTAQFTGDAGGIGLSIVNDIDCASTVRTDTLDNRTGNDIVVNGNLDLGSNTVKTNTIVNSQAGSIDINANVALTTSNLDTTSGNISTSSGAIGTTTGNIATDSGNIFTNSGNLSTGGTLETNTIDGFVAGSITVSRNLALTTNNLDTTSGNIATSSGVIQTTSGNIASDSGNIFTNSGNISTGGTLETNTIDGYVVGDITVNRNLELTTNNLGTTSGAITSATGNIGTTSGNIETTSGNISCGGSLSTDTIQSNTGGTTQIAIRSDMAFDTNKNLFFVGTGGIGGGTSSNIQFAYGTFANIQGNNQETIQFPRTSINLRTQSGTGGNITCDGGSVIFRNLPTSATGLGSGQIYNDSGTLKIV